MSRAARSAELVREGRDKWARYVVGEAASGEQFEKWLYANFNEVLDLLEEASAATLLFDAKMPAGVEIPQPAPPRGGVDEA